MRPLLKYGYVALQDVDQSRANYDTERAAVNSAEADLRNAEAGVRSAQELVQSARANVTAFRAEVVAAQKNVGAVIATVSAAQATRQRGSRQRAGEPGECGSQSFRSGGSAGEYTTFRDTERVLPRDRPVRWRHHGP